jgi:hypothetical protein
VRRGPQRRSAHRAQPRPFDGCLTAIRLQLRYVSASRAARLAPQASRQLISESFTPDDPNDHDSDRPETVQPARGRIDRHSADDPGRRDHDPQPRGYARAAAAGPVARQPGHDADRKSNDPGVENCQGGDPELVGQLMTK